MRGDAFRLLLLMDGYVKVLINFNANWVEIVILCMSF